jgi:hypothetical protein
MPSFARILSVTILALAPKQALSGRPLEDGAAVTQASNPTSPAISGFVSTHPFNLHC